MERIQMTLDEDLIKEVDKLSKRLHTSRSAFARQALRDALSRYNVEQLEQKHKHGYEQNPVGANEFSVWEEEQAWGDA